MLSIRNIVFITCIMSNLAFADAVAQTSQNPLRETRREVLSIKTNLLEWGAYVPQYGMCPMPNVELEFYPKSGHWTFGATFDFPWWKGNTENHKYFELNNLQLYARYYTRDSEMGFRGFYMQGYAQAFLYQIGFSATKGWVGEGVGGGVGIGYVLPLSRNGHWRLDFGLQLGVFVTKYDPYVYGSPLDGTEDGKYYYDYLGDNDLFRKREYSLTWFGPTRIGISISYDIFYRRRNNAAQRSLQKGDGL